ncbi:hypothetical protein [Tropicimonas sediminicola]|uniref:Uncharacterized protein n=1 Tax=Tropicimonas sediminicola TaxID=1031541 RepID=A0A239ESG6_9RHOB|nr:hypothetical protein [Tropicimonas sediminicola]SNS47577.1 hypothetical protein SAMN05421757_102309 [Tropicimonas sediminicola]
MTQRKILLSMALVLALAPQVSVGQSVQRLSTASGLSAIGPGPTFEVWTRAGMGKADYFCAAGDFAKRRLGADNSDTLTVVSGRAPSKYAANREAFTFALGAAGSTSSVGEMVAGPRTGQTSSVRQARVLCSQARVNQDRGK